MNLYQLYYFKTMAKLEHYTKAAEALSMTQPSLSHAISTLETELEIPLFEKQGRNVKLTKYGRQLLPFVENALDELESGIKKVKEMTESTISIGFIYTLSTQYIPNLINHFIQQESNLDCKFQLKEGRGIETCTESLVRSLKGEKLDLIFISLIPDDPEIEFIYIGEQNLVAVLPNNCPLASQESIDLADTKPYSLIQYSTKVGLKREISGLFEQVNVVPTICCEVEDELSMAGLVAANIGYAIVPDSPSIRSYKNVQIRPISNPGYKRGIYLGYMKNRYMTRSVQDFKDYVVENAYVPINALEASI
jgi:DNA-binding transcriptional LysR family regulator